MTDPLLDLVEVRVLGALAEKQLTTPEYYPLTLNALRTACNQKSNRDPVVDFDDKTVVRAFESLRDKQLARQVSGGDQRVPRYYHLLSERLDLEEPSLAALCVLMLRGPQTRRRDTGARRPPASLRRSGGGGGGPVRADGPRRAPGRPAAPPGRPQERRYAHLLAGSRKPLPRRTGERWSRLRSRCGGPTISAWTGWNRRLSS